MKDLDNPFFDAFFKFANQVGRCTKPALFVSVLTLVNSVVQAEPIKDEWIWFGERYDASASKWDHTEGIADVCVVNGKLIASLFRRDESSQDPPLPHVREAGKRYTHRHPGFEEFAEITARLKQNRPFRAIYSRWGTDEYGLYVTGDYFLHRFKGGGMEALTFYATGTMQYGLRRNLGENSATLLAHRNAYAQCPLSEDIEISE